MLRRFIRRHANARKVAKVQFCREIEINIQLRIIKEVWIFSLILSYGISYCLSLIFHIIGLCFERLIYLLLIHTEIKGLA